MALRDELTPGMIDDLFAANLLMLRDCEGDAQRQRELHNLSCWFPGEALTVTAERYRSNAIGLASA